MVTVNTGLSQRDLKMVKITDTQEITTHSLFIWIYSVWVLEQINTYLPNKCLYSSFFSDDCLHLCLYLIKSTAAKAEKTELLCHELLIYLLVSIYIQRPYADCKQRCRGAGDWGAVTTPKSLVFSCSHNSAFQTLRAKGRASKTLVLTKWPEYTWHTCQARSCSQEVWLPSSEWRWKGHTAAMFNALSLFLLLAMSYMQMETCRT